MAKYYVTDPCYLMDTNSEKGNEIWMNFCKVMDSNYDKAKEILSKGIKSDFIEFEDTGFGDWSNTLIGPNVTKSEFAADSGMVCVVKSTPELEEYISKEYRSDNWLIAVFETEGEITVEFDISNPNWTIVNISDTLGNHWETDNGDFDDEEDDDEYNDYDDNEDEE